MYNAPSNTTKCYFLYIIYFIRLGYFLHTYFLIIEDIILYL